MRPRRRTITTGGVTSPSRLPPTPPRQGTVPPAIGDRVTLGPYLIRTPFDTGGMRDAKRLLPPHDHDHSIRFPRWPYAWIHRRPVDARTSSTGSEPTASPAPGRYTYDTHTDSTAATSPNATPTYTNRRPYANDIGRWNRHRRSDHHATLTHIRTGMVSPTMTDQALSTGDLILAKVDSQNPSR